MEELVDRFRSVIERATGKLARIGETESADPVAPRKWSRKQILGHLIDSAANNHQRFVRSQLESPLHFPGYAQEEWVKTQNYQEESWGYLVACWAGYNRHLLHVITQIPTEKLNHLCEIGGGRAGDAGISGEGLREAPGASPWPDYRVTVSASPGQGVSR